MASEAFDVTMDVAGPEGRDMQVTFEGFSERPSDASVEKMEKAVFDAYDSFFQVGPVKFNTRVVKRAVLRGRAGTALHGHRSVSDQERVLSEAAPHHAARGQH